MNEGSRFYSDSRRCYIELQTDGNLVLYRAFDRKAFWESGTHGKDIPNVQFQSDGNLVLYDRGGSAVWSSYTDNKGAKRLVMQDDGNFVMYDGKEKAVWSTHTSGIGACRGRTTKPPKSCFPGSSKVKLTTGESRTMTNLKTGDSIMTIVDGKLTSTEVLGFLFKNYGSGAYLTIHTKDGNKISLSGTHVMFVNDYEDVLAEDVNIGDSVIIEVGEFVNKSRVVKIEAEKLDGAYVPLTEQGTLLVDGVLCSSFANVPHGIAQLLAAPMRWFPSMFLSDEEGERLFVTAAKHLGYYLNKLGLLNYYHSHALQKDEEPICDLNSLEKKTLEEGPLTGSMNVDTCPIISIQLCPKNT